MRVTPPRDASGIYLVQAVQAEPDPMKEWITTLLALGLLRASLRYFTADASRRGGVVRTTLSWPLKTIEDEEDRISREDALRRLGVDVEPPRHVIVPFYEHNRNGTTLDFDADDGEGPFTWLSVSRIGRWRIGWVWRKWKQRQMNLTRDIRFMIDGLRSRDVL